MKYLIHFKVYELVSKGKILKKKIEKLDGWNKRFESNKDQINLTIMIYKAIDKTLKQKGGKL